MARAVAACALLAVLGAAKGFTVPSPLGDHADIDSAFHVRPRNPAGSRLFALGPGTQSCWF
jgi:hypothetical protein